MKTIANKESKLNLNIENMELFQQQKNYIITRNFVQNFINGKNIIDKYERKYI